MTTRRQLEYLVALADEQHFRKAADKCNVSQPTLSMQIKELEEKLGQPLVERRPKRVLLTDVGREVVSRARSILIQFNELENVCDSFHAPLEGPLKLGAFPTLSPYYFPLIVPKLKHDYAKLKLYLREEKSANLVEKLHEGSLDAGLLALPLANEERLQYVPLFKECFYVAISKKHRLVDAESISLEEITGELLLLEEGHCLRQQALDACKLPEKYEDSANFRATSLETLKQMVACDLGVTLLPELATHNLPEGIVVKPIKGPKQCREIALVWRNTSPRNAELKMLAEVLKKI